MNEAVIRDNGDGGITRVSAKRRIDQHLAPFFGGSRAVDITTDRVRAYTVERRGQGASNATINRELASLKRMFNLATEMTPPIIKSPACHISPCLKRITCARASSSMKN